MGQCLKCGKKTDGRSVFCNDCLAVMDRYPVKSGTVVHIPTRPAAPAATAHSGNSTAMLKELISRQKTLIRWLAGIAALLSVLLLLTAAMLIQTLRAEQTARPTIGRNYTTSTTTRNP